MASITIEVGPLSSSRTFDDTKAQRTLSGIADMLEVSSVIGPSSDPPQDPWTPQDGLDAVLDWIVDIVRGTAIQQEQNALREGMDIELEALKDELI
jgi:hypothetical protein